MAKSITLTRSYPHPPEKVWKAISNSEALAKWLMPNNFKLELGHRFYFQTKKQPGFDGNVSCEVLGFEEGRFLEYSWQGGPMKTPTIVRWELEPTSEGTLVKLHHSGFEGWVNEIFVRMILRLGWKNLLRKKMARFLQYLIS
jgi:uncharacterized protein YndB with AHSA1/START domain